MKNIRILILALLLLATVVGLSACGGSPDSVEDPLAQFGSGVSALLPFPTRGTDEVTPAPTWDASAYDATPLPTTAPTSYGYIDLTYGATGDQVMALQARLKALGYFAGQLDGKYADSTASAVRLFQGQLGVTKTGIATSSLQRMLFSSSAPKYGTTAVEENPYDTTGEDGFDPFEDYTTPRPTPRATTNSGSTNSDFSGSTSASGYYTLSRGDKGAMVSDLQRALKALGYYTGNIDGDYGTGTAAAVKRFQQMYGQNQTGVATEALQKKLFSGDAVRYTPPATPTPVPVETYSRLSYGSYGKDVIALQKRLKKLGYFEGTADGDFSDSTEEAIMRFQKQVGLAQDGIATAALQRRIYASNAPTYKPPTTPRPTAQPSDDYKTLRPGDTGERVKELQRRLKQLGYFDGEIGGNYLTLTTDAVKRFQKAVGLDETGIATAALQRRIFAENAPIYKPKQTPKPTPKPTEKPDYPELSEGDSGSSVTRLQERLADLGYYQGQITGGFGKNTTAAVKLFQKAIDAKQTGIATTAMQRILYSNDAPTHNAPVVTPPAEPKYSRLKPGDTGEKVKELQRRLKKLGFFDGDIGGNYLTKTTNAVKAFQKALGWEQTGIATTDLQEKLFSDNAPTKGEDKKEETVSDSSYRMLKKGDSGDDVYQLQIRLIDLGFMGDFTSDSQGEYGNETRQAVIDVQMARGFDSDGAADVEFQKFLFSKNADSISRNEYEGG